MGYLFEDYLDAVAARMREPDSASKNLRYQADLPYVVQTELMQILVMALNQTLREVDPSDWQSVSSDAVNIVSGGTVGSEWSTLAIPANTLRVLSVQVDGEPAVLSSLASFVQSLGSRRTSAVTVMGGNLLFHGASITATLLVEPTLGVWQMASKPILPSGYEIRALDIAARRILIADYVMATVNGGH